MDENKERLWRTNVFKLGFAVAIFAALDSIEAGDLETFKAWVYGDEFKRDFADELLLVHVGDGVDQVPFPPKVNYLRGIS